MNKFDVAENYLINPRTFMLLPARHVEYETIVIERDKQFLVKETGLELMERACSRYAATFDGRRKSVMEQTGFERKVPIPVSIYFDIYAFPTHAIKNHDCMWIFGNHVHHVERIPATNRGDKEKSLMVFPMGSKLSWKFPSIQLKSSWIGLKSVDMCLQNTYLRSLVGFKLEA